jgi:hypothetical protein
MAWIKRNLYFLIGGGVALALMGLAGWYLYSKWQLNNTILEDLDKEYGELVNLNNQNPHPGSGKVDNIKEAREQRQQLRDFLQKARPYFQRIPPIPDLPKMTDGEFSTALSRAIDQMQRDATTASVNLPPKYSFSFEAQKQGLVFAAGSLTPLSVQLGEVKAICEILFHAKVNWLDNIRRERVSSDDTTGLQTDYLAQRSVTNDLAILTPYELTFRCFSSELASVLSGFASSPNGLIVKTINVELAPAAASETPGGAIALTATPYVPSPVAATPVPANRVVAAEPAAAETYNRRYGGGTGPGVGGVPLRGPAPATPAYGYPTAAPGAAAIASGPRGLPTVLDEKQLKITLALDVVKLLPAK